MKGDMNPDVQVPIVTANATVLLSHSVSSKMNPCMPPKTTWVTQVAANVAAAAIARINHP